MLTSLQLFNKSLLSIKQYIVCLFCCNQAVKCLIGLLWFIVIHWYCTVLSVFFLIVNSFFFINIYFFWCFIVFSYTQTEVFPLQLHVHDSVYITSIIYYLWLCFLISRYFQKIHIKLCYYNVIRRCFVFF